MSQRLLVFYPPKSLELAEPDTTTCQRAKAVALLPECLGCTSKSNRTDTQSRPLDDAPIPPP